MALSQAAAKAALAKQTTEIISAGQSIEDRDWDVGHAVDVIQSEGLVHLSGEGTLVEYLEQHVLPSLPDIADVRQLFDYASVAHEFSKNVTIKRGISKLRLLQTYAHHHNLKLPPDPGKFLVNVPGPKGMQRKPFAQCSARDLRLAIQGAHGHHPAPTPTPEPTPRPVPGPKPDPNGKLPAEDVREIAYLQQMVDSHYGSKQKRLAFVSGERVGKDVYYVLRARKDDFAPSCACLIGPGPGPGKGGRRKSR